MSASGPSGPSGPLVCNMTLQRTVQQFALGFQTISVLSPLKLFKIFYFVFNTGLAPFNPIGSDMCINPFFTGNM